MTDQSDKLRGFAQKLLMMANRSEDQGQANELRTIAGELTGMAANADVSALATAIVETDGGKPT